MFSRTDKTNSKTALDLAAAGDREAQFGLGLKYSTGDGTALDYAQAADWYRRAAEQSHGMAQFNLGVMYTEGHGVSRDGGQARLWFGKAATQGDAGAQHHLGLSFQRAIHGSAPAEAGESRIEAYKWFSLAAAQGYNGSAAACELVNITMSRAEVTAGNERLTAMRAELPGSTTDGKAV
jgi:TPR repeat protein